MDFHIFDRSCRLALKNYIRLCPQYTGSLLLNSDYEGSKIDLLSKIWIFFEKVQKVAFFKKSEKNHDISEDAGRKAHDTTQKITDKFVAEVDKIIQTKEKDIIEVYFILDI